MTAPALLMGTQFMGMQLMMGMLSVIALIAVKGFILIVGLLESTVFPATDAMSVFIRGGVMTLAVLMGTVGVSSNSGVLPTRHHSSFSW